ncbi:MAG: bifunctional DNA-formamidopyrimidine glycosylase/DNA-(apurinic or apyrimidinic site) lyase [Bauldia sp.]|mgnify:CR=1 FL=1
MPELPEVETVRLGLEPAMAGARFTAVTLQRGDLRRPFPKAFARRLTGRRVTALTRRGKFILANLDDDEVLVMHLGMSGSFRIAPLRGAHSHMPGDFHLPRSEAAAHDHVVFEMSSGKRITYNDPRRFGLMDLVPAADVASSRHFAEMGVEPLGEEFTPEFLARRFAGRAVPLKAALLDQHVIAGLGNIYASEALWRAKLSPLRPAASMARKDGKPSARAAALVAACRAVLEEAIAAGGSTLRNHALTDGSLGTFQMRFAVYDREGEACVRPHRPTRIRRIVQGGRSTFFCPTCQR